MNTIQSVVLNQNQDGLWQYVIVGAHGNLLQTSLFTFESLIIAAEHARMWLDNPHN